jgi:hypothetical protein
MRIAAEITADIIAISLFICAAAVWLALFSGA